MSMKNSNDTIGNRTHDLPAFSAVPQPTAPLRAPKLKSKGAAIFIVVLPPDFDLKLSLVSPQLLEEGRSCRFLFRLFY
jgi:hypothetical protein